MTMPEDPAKPAGGSDGRSSDKNMVGFMFGGMAGVSSLCVVQMIAMEHLSWCQNLSLYFFAFSIPPLVMVLGDYGTLDEGGSLKKMPCVAMLFAALGLLASVAGFSLLFFHFSVAIGVVFLISVSGVALLESPAFLKSFFVSFSESYGESRRQAQAKAQQALNEQGGANPQ